MTRRIPPRILLVLAAATLTMTGCTLLADGSADQAPDGGRPERVVLVTHESFALPGRLVADFESQSGYDLMVRSSGDAGALTNKLVLTKDDPIGDVAFGVDNTFASRAVGAGVFEAYGADLPAGAERYRLPGEDADALTPIDHGAVCVNVDKTWFAANDVPQPRTLEDLTEPAYRDLFVTPAATTSSPGMAFLLATIAEYGDAWPGYWARLMANGTKLTSGWSDAYQVDFTQGGGSGDRPIVLSYDSSPAFTVPDGGGPSTTKALLGTCFEQVEYAGVLAGAANPDGARALVDFLLSDKVQKALPESMYVFPVAADVELPPDWATYAKQPTDPYTLDPQLIDENRDQWLRQWTDVTTR